MTQNAKEWSNQFLQQKLLLVFPLIEVSEMGSFDVTLETPEGETAQSVSNGKVEVTTAGCLMTISISWMAQLNFIIIDI